MAIYMVDKPWRSWEKFLLKETHGNVWRHFWLYIGELLMHLVGRDQLPLHDYHESRQDETSQNCCDLLKGNYGLLWWYTASGRYRHRGSLHHIYRPVSLFLHWIFMKKNIAGNILKRITTVSAGGTSYGCCYKIAQKSTHFLGSSLKSLSLYWRNSKHSNMPLRRLLLL